MKRSWKSCALVVSLTAIITACATPDTYVQRVAPIDVPADYGRGHSALNTPSEPLVGVDDVEVPDTRTDFWWRGFGDARLERMVEQVLDANSDLVQAGWALHQARLQAGLAHTNMLPQFDMGVDGRISRRIDIHDDEARSVSSDGQISWQVDLFGKLRAQRDVQVWRAHATAEDLQATALSLIGETCRLYWTLAYLNQAIASGEQDLEELERISDLVSIQHDVGEVSRLEVRESEQALHSQRAAQSALVQQRVETRNAITVLLDGQPWSMDDEPQTLDHVDTLTVREGIPAEILGRRPDLRAAELRLQAALASIKATARSYYPALSLTGSVSAGGTSLSSVVDNPVAVLGAGLSFPFLNVRRMRIETDIAGTAYLEEASAFRNALYAALKEADDALSAREQALKQVEAYERSRDSSRDVASIYEVRYRSGAGTLRNWLDARQSARNADLALAQARRSQLQNEVTLVEALGSSGADWLE